MVAVGVVVAVAVGAVLAVQVTVVAVAVAVGDVVEGVVRVVGLKVGVEAVVAVVVTLREVEIVVGAAMYLQQVKQYGLVQICGMPFWLLLEKLTPSSWKQKFSHLLRRLLSETGKMSCLVFLGDCCYYFGKAKYY